MTQRARAKRSHRASAAPLPPAVASLTFCLMRRNARGRGRRLSWEAIALLFGVGVPAPLVATLAYLTHAPIPVLALAALAVLPGLHAMRTPWDISPRSRAQLWLRLWPFFVSWTLGLAFWFWAPLALVVAAIGVIDVRTSLGAASVAAVITGLFALRRSPRVVTKRVRIKGLPTAFAGYRIAHVTDVHCGVFTPAARVRRWMERVNRLDADVVAVTGDLITSGTQHVESVAEALGTLRARDGVFASLGNHDYFGVDGGAFARELERHGLCVLRNRGLAITREDAALYLAGVDDTWTARDDVARALAARPHEAPVVLLAHDPALFPEAARGGVALVLSGHTHGGQIAVPLARKHLNLARLTTPYSSGLYRDGHSTLYVNAGLGTTGPPIRIGARPEIAIIVLEPDGEATSERLPAAPPRSRHTGGDELAASP